MGLTNDERLVVNSELERRGKNMLLAYVLLIFLGTVGAHRFYLGKTGTAVTMLLLTIVGYVTLIILVGFVLIGIVGLWVLIDLFLIPGIIQADNDKLEQQIILEVKNR